MKISTFCIILFTALVLLVPVHKTGAVELSTAQDSEICSQICSYKRLGIRTYVDACMQGCTMYQQNYATSGNKTDSLAVCKAGCPSVTRDICEYGCNVAKRSFP